MCGRWRVAADVLVRDAGAVRGLAAQQAAARRPGRLPRRAGAQGNPARAAPRAPAPLPPLAPPAPAQLPRRTAVPQLLLTPSLPTPPPDAYCSLTAISFFLLFLLCYYFPRCVVTSNT